MNIFKDVSKMASILLAILHTRLELAAVEVQEEAHRFLFYLLLSLLALFCVMVAIHLAVLLIIVLFWDTWRVGMICVLLVFFAGAAIIVGLGIRSSIRNKPGFLAYTRGELAKDIERISSKE
jgi:uncharacterized membrane protein YqjE